MATYEGKTPEQLAHEITSVKTTSEHVRDLAKQLGVPQRDVEAYIKRRAYAKRYATKRNAEFRAFRELVNSDDALKLAVREAVNHEASK